MHQNGVLADTQSPGIGKGNGIGTSVLDIKCSGEKEKNLQILIEDS